MKYKFSKDPLFGKYCYIDTPWIAGKNTIYRIVNSGVRSNAWVEVPIRGRAEVVTHDHYEDVVYVVLDTLIDEDSRIKKVALKDIVIADTPQTDCGDFADRLAYERGVKHAWEVAQKVFDSTVTFYKAEAVAKQIADTPQTDCDTCRYGQDKHRYAHICNECGVGINNYTPQTDCEVITDTSYQVLDGWQTREKPKTTDCPWK